MTIRNYATLAIALGMLALVSWLWWTADSRERAIERAKTATDQSELHQEATKTVEHVLRTETIVQTKAAEAYDDIASQPGADAPITDDVLASWRSGIDGVRQAAASGADPGP